MTEIYDDQRHHASYPPSLWGGGGVVTPHIPTPTTYVLPPDVAHFTIAQIQQWVDDHADQADEILTNEQARGDDARVTLVTWLQGFISQRDEGIEPDGGSPEDEP